MFIRRDCLDAVGLLREDLFAQGYGEENDWCLRARHRGWRHVAAPGSFVAHAGGASFGPARRHLVARNSLVLNRLQPRLRRHGDGVDRPRPTWRCAPPHRRAALAVRGAKPRLSRWSRTAGVAASIGWSPIVRRACGARGCGPVVLRPDEAWTVVGDGDTPNLRYRLPAEWDKLLRLLRGERVVAVELHHALGHAPDVLQLADRLGVAQQVFVHDYASFCPRIALVPEHAYCGEPPIAGCEACIADHGSKPSTKLSARRRWWHARQRCWPPPPASWFRRPTSRAACGGISPACLPRLCRGRMTATSQPLRPSRRIRHVCVIGAIGVEKGYERLLGCARDAAARKLGLRFTVVGYTADDERLIAGWPGLRHRPAIRRPNWSG